MNPMAEDGNGPAYLLVWRRLDMPGHDACGLWLTAKGWCLKGTAVLVLAGMPCWLSYEVSGEVPWLTRCGRVTGCLGTRTLDLRMVALADGRWQLNGIEQPVGAGCVDLDLNFTPATNLIPLRRLDLAVGEAADAPAAWLDIPDGGLMRLEQHYQRVGPDAYDYRAPGIGYAATLQVAETGFVTRYPGLWEMEALRGA
ncbi:MAG: putative glycolipid-binding domain-containing protein [Gammaproteobacteria bacterium]|nr:putative glycolipid-binding domain-containing protein [Gammaproteobacteria bacterium]